LVGEQHMDQPKALGCLTTKEQEKKFKYLPQNNK
jgi:hypothetical protein